MEEVGASNSDNKDGDIKEIVYFCVKKHMALKHVSLKVICVSSERVFIRDKKVKDEERDKEVTVDIIVF